MQLLEVASILMTNFEIREATEQDVPVILNLIRELAEYEREPDAVVATEEGLREVLFGAKPSAEVLLALEEGAPVGFAVYFYNFSTWLGRPGLYLEDLFVRPAARGKGYGRALLVELDGSVDWLCFPRFDSGACFAALLGDEKNGCWRFLPADEIKTTRRHYRGDTLILETDIKTGTGVVRLIDFMPPRGKNPDLVRIIHGIRGRVAMQMQLIIRF